MKASAIQRPLSTPPQVAGTALAVMFGALLVQFGMVQMHAGFLGLQALLMSVVVLATAFLGDRQGKFDIRQPWAVLMVFHLPFWIIGSFKTVLDPEQRISWIPWAEEQMPLALLLVSMGFVCIAVGYRLGLGMLPPATAADETTEWDCSRLLPLTVIGYLTVWPVRYYFYQNYLAKSYSAMLLQTAPPTYINLFDGVIPRFLLLVVWAAYYTNTTQKKWLWLGLCLTVGELIWGVFTGNSKAMFFLPVFIPIVPYIILKRRIPMVRIAVSAAILLLLAYPYVSAMREVYYTADGPDRAEARRQAFSEGWYWSAPTVSGLQQYADLALDRSGGLGALSQLLQMEENGELNINGAFYIRSLQGLVPRLLWPGKPILLEGVYFSAFLQGQRGIENIDTSTISGSVAPTLFGSFYWNLGWPGLVLTSLALGIFSGLVYQSLQRKGFTNPAIFLYYSAILAVLETTEQEVVKLPSSLAWGLITVWAAIRVLGWHKSGTAPAVGAAEVRPEQKRKRGRVRRRQGGSLPATGKPSAVANQGGAAPLTG